MSIKEIADMMGYTVPQMEILIISIIVITMLTLATIAYIDLRRFRYY